MKVLRRSLVMERMFLPALYCLLIPVSQSDLQSEVTILYLK